MDDFKDYKNDPSFIAITKGTMYCLLDQEHPAELIALYSFYLYCANWQGENEPHAVLSFCAEGLGWSEKTVRKYKGQLREIGLIENIMMKDSKGKVIPEGHRIRIRYLEYCHPGKIYRFISHPGKKTTPVKFTGERKRVLEDTNICPNEKSRSDGPPSLRENKTPSFYEKAAQSLIRSIRRMNPRIKKVSKEPWIRSIRLLHQKDGVHQKEIKSVLKWYESHCTDEFVPKMYHYRPADFRTRWAQIIAAKTRWDTDPKEPDGPVKLEKRYTTDKEGNKILIMSGAG